MGRTASYWLIGLEGKARKFQLPIDAPILVGRGAYNHVVLDDVRLSRQHARIAPERDGYVVYDLNSINGSYVNGVAVTRQFLQPNDILRFGPYGFRVESRPLPKGAPNEAAREPDHPTLRSLESVSKMTSAAESRDSTTHLPVVDLTQLEDAYENLGTLYAFMQAISKTIDKRELLELISAKIRENYPIASSVGIYLRSGPEAPDELFRLAHFFGAEKVPAGSETLSDEVILNVLDAGQAILMADSQSVRRAGTSMYAPMIDRDDALGVIHVIADERAGTFSRADLDLLSGMATPAAIMIQNTRMHESSLARDRLNHDLELAAQIQKSFLPREVITVEGLELFAEYRAAYTVGGDFYDVFWVAPNRLAMFIGDISGKGVAAAILMARISSELRVAALAAIEPVAVLKMMNEATIGHGQPELYFTAVYLTLDVSTGEMLLANAGHPTPYRVHADGTVEAITAGASGAVGILDDGGFTVTSLKLAHGDSLVLYTDGVVEASDAHSELYGSERLEACLKGAGPRPSDIAEHILRSVASFGVDGPVNDDLTLFICHRIVGRPPSLQPRRRSSTKIPALTIPKRTGS